jgi:GNAT superfamily N-acetyltransferase
VPRAEPIALEIRRMRPEEIARVVDVWERSRWDALPWLEERMGHTHEDNLRFFRDNVAARNQVWVALDEGTVVGLLALAESTIEQLFVDPEWQGRGVGSALIERAKALAPGGLGLFTHQRNARARRFYERRGFRAVSFGTSPPPESEPDVRYEWEPGAK